MATTKSMSFKGGAIAGDPTPIPVPVDALFIVRYNETPASDIDDAIHERKVPYLIYSGKVAELFYASTNSFTFRTTHVRNVDGENILDIVDYKVTGSSWSTSTKEISNGYESQAYLKSVSSPAIFDTTGQSGMKTVASVSDVPNDGIYQVSVMLSVTPKTPSPTKSDLVFGFYGPDGIGMPNHTFHAVVDDSQTFAQQLSFSTTLNLKAGTNTLKMACGGLNTEYLVFVDDLTVAQLVNGVYHNGDSFDEVHTLPEESDLNDDDGLLVDGATSGPRFMLWRTFKDKVLGVLKNLFSAGSNPEYLYTITDSDGVLLFSIGKDGAVDWAKGIPEHLQNILNNIVTSLASKVDKVTGKSLIDAVFANGVSVVTNEEYLLAVTDANSSVLFGVEKDGTFTWSKGIPSHIKEPLERLLYEITTKVDKVTGKSLIDAVFANGVSIANDEEFVLAFTDSDGRFLFGIRKDGSVDWAKGVPQSIQDSLNTLQQMLNGKQNAIPRKTVIDSKFSNHMDSNDEDQEWFKVVCDSVGRLVEGIRATGEHVFMLPVQLDGGVNWTKENLDDLSRALKENGFTGGTGDWSDNSSLEIPVPELAIINFTNISQMPQTKTTDAQAIMEFWDMNGNYFKKKVIANAQGSSSLAMPKKNIGIDICNDDWIGDDTFKIKFGGWVPQDSFHIKAYYTDFFRCVGLSGYDLVKKILDTRVPNTTWKKALNYGTDPVGQKNVSPQVDSGALCYPQGFLCKVYLNGVFEGLFCWQLKKHRDNYNLNKKTAENIHLDGMLGGVFFGGTIDWTAFEIRNPKDLITYTGTKYDGDNPTELIDSTSPVYDPANSKHKLSAKVKQYIIDLSHRMAQIGNDPSVFEQYFDVDSCVDYAILSDTIYNYDYVKNIQWTTWDGVKWFINPYDLDCTLGANSSGDGIHYPSTSHITTATNHPLKFVLGHYNSELEQRWKELRDAHIIDARVISENLEHYVRLFGKDGYKSEYDKWTNVPCNREPVIDTDNWELEVDADGNPVIYTTQSNNWNGTTTYTQGNIVQYNLTGSSIGNFGWWFRFTAKQTNTNKPPITQRGFKDNIFRVYNWLNLQISNMDTVYNYT